MKNSAVKGIFQLVILLSAFEIKFLASWEIDITYPGIESENEVNGLWERRKERLNLIFPGTKWCGSGNLAESSDDLGYFAVTDACCREHDQCEDVIEVMQTKYNLTNPTFYTRVECTCDETFYDCLHSSDEKIAPQIGTLYFTFLNTQCFRYDYPIISCKHYSTYPRRCMEYELDERQPKIYQWFDVPLY